MPLPDPYADAPFAPFAIFERDDGGAWLLSGLQAALDEDLAGEADPEEARRQLLRGIEQLSQVFQDPDSRSHLGAATDAVVEGRFYQAMRSLRNLLPREARLLGVRPAG